MAKQNKEKRTQNSITLIVFLSVFFFYLGIFLGNKGIMKADGNIQNNTTTFCEPCKEKICLDEHPDYDYLKKSACALYSNFRDLYLQADENCNSDYSCRGSAMQKESYESFKSWDSFQEEYCE